MPDRAWVWLGADTTIQHLTTPPDDIQRQWNGETVCGLEGSLMRVSWENVDGGKSCMACRSKPFTLSGDHRGPP
jgi:hypothetical protein